MQRIMPYKAVGYSGSIRQFCERLQTAISLVLVSVDSLLVLVWTTLSHVT